MADYLVYWKTYWTDDSGPSYVGEDWSTTSKGFYARVKKGDRLWVVVTAGPRAPKEWRLLSQFTVDRRGIAQTRWGKFQMHAVPASSLNFKLAPQPDLAAILRLLTFRGGKPIRVKGGAVGKALQTHGYRSLSEKDADVLVAYSSTLPREPA